MLMSHPSDFTPVCTTELGAVARLKPKFDRRCVKVLALSVDSLSAHKEWVHDINRTQDTTVNFPIIADPDAKISQQYGMIHPRANDTMTVRSVFIIAPDNTIKLTITYPASTGRNFDEILRVIDSLQLTTDYSVATPANWRDGQDCMILPTVPDGDLPAKFPKGFTKITSYIRTTPQPNR